MGRNIYALVAAATAIGLVVSACSRSPHPSVKTPVITPTATSTATTTTAQTTTTTTTTTASSAQLQALIPTPINTQRTDGPDSIPDNGIRMHFLVNGSPSDVMDAYKAELEGKGWTVTVLNSGGGPGGGGATYTGTQSDAYGVFTGGGTGNKTFLNACAWPSKPSNPNCAIRR